VNIYINCFKYGLSPCIDIELLYLSMLGSRSSMLHPISYDNRNGCEMTLRRLSVWMADPLERLRIIASLAESTEGLRGGKSFPIETSFANYFCFEFQVHWPHPYILTSLMVILLNKSFWNASLPYVVRLFMR
jgi:hypothetical protein